MSKEKETSSHQREIIFSGLPASGGIAIGPAYLFEREEVFVVERTLSGVEVDLEINLFHQAIERAKHELTKISTFAKAKVGQEIADVFETQIMMLDDVEVVRSIERRIVREKKNADFLIHTELQKFKAMMAQSQDPVFRDRIVDLDEVGQRLLRCLQKKRLHSNVEGSHVIVAANLTPADTILFSKQDVLGYATELGGITSHAAILSRSLKIPAVVALHNVTKLVKTGDLLIIDGQKGVILAHPTEEHLHEYEKKIRRIEEFERSLEGMVDLQSITPDGRAIELSANAEFVNEMEYVIAQGSNGIGLYRTEHLCIATGDFPSEEEQFLAYSQIAFEMYPQSVIFRTFDIGGDKYLQNEYDEENPSLGWRGIRMMLGKPEIFRVQLRAIFRASIMKNVKLMFPMISGVVEQREALSHVHAVQNELREKGIPFDENMEIGAMIEVPSALFVADDLAQEVDFFSIGTNDLVQYLLAVDRNNVLIKDMYQEFHPAVLRAIKHIIDAGHRNDIWVGVCGEMGGNLLATVLLLGMGIDELSMVPSMIPEVKKIVRSTKYEDAKRIADIVLKKTTYGEITDYLSDIAHNKIPEFFEITENGK